MEKLKQSLDFYWPLPNPKYRIVANMDGISSTPGHNGYKVTVWDYVSHDDQKPLANFIVELNGNLYNESEESPMNLKIFNDHALGKIIIKEAQLSN